LNKRDMLERRPDPPRGVLNLKVDAALPGHWRYLPSAALAPFVEHYWMVEWSVAEPQLRETLPHPSVHIVLERGKAELAGVATGRFTRVLEGSGRVLGVKFRPGGFRPLVAQPVSAYTDRVQPLAAVFGAPAGCLALEALAQPDHAASLAVLESFLLGLDPRPDPMTELAARIAAAIAADRSLLTVEQVGAAFELKPRRLQRLFEEYVGVGPKWVIQRCRLHEAAQRLAGSPATDCAVLALELGYADQAHFIRDFKKIVGRSPGQYVSDVHGLRN
jgi:AraC-like DNA-binding protein